MTERLFPLTHNTSIFITQAIISIAVLSLMGYLLIDGGDAGKYLPIVSGIVGAWLPSPMANLKPTQPQNLIQSPQTTVAEGTNTYINPPVVPEIKIDKPDLHQQIADTVVHPEIINKIQNKIKQNGTKTTRLQEGATCCATREQITNTVVHPEIVDKINTLISGNKTNPSSNN